MWAIDADLVLFFVLVITVVLMCAVFGTNRLAVLRKIVSILRENGYTDAVDESAMDGRKPWIVRDKVKLQRPKVSPRDAASTRLSPLYVSIIDYRNMSQQYGATYPATLSTRTADLGYTRALKTYKRVDVRYVPNVSQDSNRCDEWMVEQEEARTAMITANKNGKLTRGEDGYVSNLVNCDVNAGADACFRCIESRRYMRACVHLSRPLTVANAMGVEQIIPANRSPDEGWCLPDSFRNVKFDNDRPKPIDNQVRNCNPNTGNWILSRLVADGRDGVDSSYNWICRCRYPNLMTNLGDATSDCLLPVGCQPYGRLDEQSRNGAVDPYTSGTCVCSTGYRSDFQASIGPTCVPLNVLEFGLNNVYGRVLDGKNYVPLQPKYLSKQFLSILPDDQRHSLVFPNPCNVESYSGRALTNFECYVTLRNIDGEVRALCVSGSPNYVAHRSESDYLLNNHGTYPNSCLYTGMVDRDVRITDTPREEVRGSYMLSFYNRRYFPDVGHVIPYYLYDIESPVRSLQRTISDDDKYRAWYAENVTKYGDTDVMKDNAVTRLFLDASKVYTNDRSMVIYNDSAWQDEATMTLSEAIQSVPFQQEILEPLLSDDPYEPVRLMLIDSNAKQFIRPMKEYEHRENVYLLQSLTEYRNFPALPVVDDRTSCIGRGDLLDTSAVYVEYFDQPAAPDKMLTVAKQWFITGPNNPFPAEPSVFNCVARDVRGCPESKGDLKTAYNELYPKLWPVIVQGNRQLAPNVNHDRFDATVQVYLTTNFYLVMTNGYCRNYLNYRYRPKIRRYFETRPDKLGDFRVT